MSIGTNKLRHPTWKLIINIIIVFVPISIYGWRVVGSEESSLSTAICHLFYCQTVWDVKRRNHDWRVPSKHVEKSCSSSSIRIATKLIQLLVIIMLLFLLSMRSWAKSGALISMKLPLYYKIICLKTAARLLMEMFPNLKNSFKRIIIFSHY